jgi:hypothetical protein
MRAFLLGEWWLLLVMLGSLAPLGAQFASRGFLPTLRSLDRRWIFLLMFWAVLVPIYYVDVTGQTFPEIPGLLAQQTFDEIEKLHAGDRVLLSFDYDPGSQGELGPMATAFVKQCAAKHLKMYFMALWPLGPQLADDVINQVIKADYPNMVYGQDYVNLGFKSGNEAVIKTVVNNLRELYTTDSRGTSVQNIPMMQGIDNVQQMNLIINISAGYPGTKEWVQYAETPYPKIRLVAGVTGVQAPLLYPYVPEQLPGMLGAIKGAAEYEKLVVAKYGGPHPDPKYLDAQRRMAPQLFAHLLVIGLIILANIVYFADKRQERHA